MVTKAVETAIPRAMAPTSRAESTRVAPHAQHGELDLVERTSGPPLSPRGLTAAATAGEEGTRPLALVEVEQVAVEEVDLARCPARPAPGRGSP